MTRPLTHLVLSKYEDPRLIGRMPGGFQTPEHPFLWPSLIRGERVRVCGSCSGNPPLEFPFGENARFALIKVSSQPESDAVFV